MRIDENDHIQLVDIDLLRVELKRLYAIEKANTPFTSRAEVETYLKGKGFTQNDPDEFQIPEESEDVEPVMISFIGNDVVAFDSGACNTKNFTLHLSLLTPALLDKILEAK